jgi:hypothetical protein
LGRTEIVVAAIVPVSSALPSAVTQVPTFNAVGVAVTTWLYVVAAVVVTATSTVLGEVDGDAEVRPPFERVLATTKPVPLIDRTLPTAPAPRRWPAPVGAPLGRAPPEPKPLPGLRLGRAPKPPGPPGPPAVHAPFTGWETTTVTAATSVVLGVVAAGSVGCAARASTHTPTFTAALLAASVFEILVVAL